MFFIQILLYQITLLIKHILYMYIHIYMQIKLMIILFGVFGPFFFFLRGLYEEVLIDTDLSSHYSPSLKMKRNFGIIALYFLCLWRFLSKYGIH